MKRVLLVLALLTGVTVSDDSWAHEARKPPAKPAPKRKNPPQGKKNPRKVQAPAEVAEEELHSERLAILGRLKEVNDSVRDAELAATIRRLDDLEGRRHGLALKLIGRAHEQEKEDASK